MKGLGFRDYTRLYTGFCKGFYANILKRMYEGLWKEV